MPLRGADYILVSNGGEACFCRACMRETVEARDQLHGEVKRLQGIIDGLAGRVVAQSDILSRAAERNMVATEPTGHRRIFVDGKQVEEGRI